MLLLKLLQSTPGMEMAAIEDLRPSLLRGRLMGFPQSRQGLHIMLPLGSRHPRSKNQDHSQAMVRLNKLHHKLLTVLLHLLHKLDPVTKPQQNKTDRPTFQDLPPSHLKPPHS